ncbi:MAG: hypothetical protein WCB68_11635 [Pyrinomonadaceae bacterium]
MKKSLRNIALTLLACALLGATAFANSKSKKVTFHEDVKVGDAVVKKGDYKVTFDEQTNELAILDDGKVVARTAARLEERKSASKYETTYLTLKDKEGGTLLSGVNMGGKFAIISHEKAGAPQPADTQN